MPFWLNFYCTCKMCHIFAVGQKSVFRFDFFAIMV